MLSLVSECFWICFDLYNMHADPSSCDPTEKTYLQDVNNVLHVDQHQPSDRFCLEVTPEMLNEHIKKVCNNKGVQSINNRHADDFLEQLSHCTSIQSNKI